MPTACRPKTPASPHPHKTEGAFYVWPESELRDELGEDAEAFCQRFGVRPDGNAPFDPQEEFTGKNLLYTAKGLDDIASATGTTAGGGGGGAGAQPRDGCSTCGRLVRVRTSTTRC